MFWTHLEELFSVLFIGGDAGCNNFGKVGCLTSLSEVFIIYCDISVVK